jgi:hypothetical protein
VFDLIVLGQLGRRDKALRIPLVPPSSPGLIGEKIVSAWNGSIETAWTVSLGMPILARTGQVIVLTLEGWGVEGPSGKVWRVACDKKALRPSR